MVRRIRILIVDDHDAFRCAMRALLRTQPMFETVGDAADGATAVRLAAELAPDVILMDVQMPGTLDGIDATRAIKQASAEHAPRPIVIAVSSSSEWAQAMLDAGAAVFVPKERPDQIVSALRAAAGQIAERV